MWDEPVWTETGADVWVPAGPQWYRNVEHDVDWFGRPSHTCCTPSSNPKDYQVDPPCTVLPLTPFALASASVTSRPTDPHHVTDAPVNMFTELKSVPFVCAHDGILRLLLEYSAPEPMYMKDTQQQRAVQTEADWTRHLRTAWPHLRWPHGWQPRASQMAEVALDMVTFQHENAEKSVWLAARSLSVVFITRNEERTLPRVLHQLRLFTHFGGDVLVVDTGSTDHTVALAHAMGARVLKAGSRFIEAADHKSISQICQKLEAPTETNELAALLKSIPSYFHFSRARNFAHDNAHHHWTWSLDCADVILAFNWQALCVHLDVGLDSSMPKRSYSGQSAWRWKEPMYVQRYLSKHSPLLLRVERMFDRRVREYAGRVHEVPSLKKTEEMKRLAQQGKLPIRVRVEQHVLMIEHHQNPDSKRDNYMLGLALDALDHLTKARQLFYFGRELAVKGPRLRQTARKVLLAHLDVAVVGPECGGSPDGDLERGQSCMRLGELELDEAHEQLRRRGLGSASASGAKILQRARERAINWFLRSAAEYPRQRLPWATIAQLARDRKQTALQRSAAAAALQIQKGESAASEPERIFTGVVEELLAESHSETKADYE